MKKLIILLILIAFAAFSCADNELKDSDFKMDPVSNPEGALRTLFFDNMQSGIAFYEYDRPEADTAKSAFKLKLSSGLKDTIPVVQNKVTILPFEVIKPDPLMNVKITELQFSFPGLESFWLIPTLTGTQIRLIVPLLVREGLFRAEVTGSIEEVKVVAGKNDTTRRTSALKPIFLKVSKK